jgi:membrane protease YdiL (CAAX protease family)
VSVTTTTALTSTASTSTALRARSAPRVITGAIVALGCGALAARVALVDATARPTGVLVLLFCGLLIGGACLPLLDAPARRKEPIEAGPRDARAWAVVALAGIAAFAAGRALVGGHAPMSFSGYAVATSTLAAIAEEAWFRRLCFGLLLPAGPVFAICGSTVLFAAVHVATYGWWVLPLDLAAGALLGWQRAVTGSWTAPALTHVIANLLVLL